MLPQDLVCAKCWRDVFDTEAYELACTLKSVNQYELSRRVTYEVTVEEIKTATCNWCAYIREFVPDIWSPIEIVTVDLIPSHMKSCTPDGSNVFYLDLSIRNLEDQWERGAALFIYVWTDEDDCASKYVTARPVQTDDAGEAAKLQIKALLKDCASHACCNEILHDGILPTRVVEIGSSGQEAPRLVASSGIHGDFATLSYCWGKKPFLTLTESNYDQFHDRIELSTLAPTFQDAISICRDLSIPYLWIDALCIIQDSEEDKTMEMAAMKHVYGNSTLTIVAASANDIYDGIFHPRTCKEPTHQIPVRIGPGTFGTMFVNKIDAACYDERKEPIAKRAWTMQEQLLAQRTLTFTSRTVMWRCNAGVQNYDNSLFIPYKVAPGNVDNVKYSLNLSTLLLNEDEGVAQPDKALSCWLRLVTAYSFRSASDTRDKLNAIAGVASRRCFEGSLGHGHSSFCGYHAGLWTYKLARQLTWYVSRYYRTVPRDQVRVVKRTEKYRAPSWSWASLDGGVIDIDFTYRDGHESEDENEPRVICDIVDCSTTPLNARVNPLGEITGGQLTISAPVKWAWFVPSSRYIYMVPYQPHFPIRNLDAVTEATTMLTLEETKAHYANSSTPTIPSYDPAEYPDVEHNAEFTIMAGLRDETALCDSLIVLCAAINCREEFGFGIEGILLVPVPDEDDNTNGTFRRIGHFACGDNDDFGEESKVEITVV